MFSGAGWAFYSLSGFVVGALVGMTGVGGGSLMTPMLILLFGFYPTTAVGTLVGMTGMGGGSLMTPMLILIFGFNPKTAVGTDILHGAVFKSFGAWRHRQLGNVHTHLALWMLVGSGPLRLTGDGPSCP